MSKKTSPNDLGDKVEQAGKKLDEHMDKFAKHGLVDSVMENSLIKSILESSIFLSLNESIRPHFGMLMNIVAVLVLVGGIIGVLSIFGGLGMLFNFGLGNSGFVVMFIIGAVGSIFSLIEGYGILKKKSWIPFFVIIVFLRNIISVIFGQLFWASTYGYANKTGGYIIGFLLGALLLLVILKNKSYFSE